MWAFCESVPFWVGLSVRLCWRVSTWAFCKAVLAGAGKSSAFCEAAPPDLWPTSSNACGLSVPFWVRLSVMLCWRVVMKASCQAILAGAGRSSGLAVRLHWRESSKPGGGGAGEPPNPTSSKSCRVGRVPPLSRRERAPTRGRAPQLVKGWGGPTLVKKGTGSGLGGCQTLAFSVSAV